MQEEKAKLTKNNLERIMDWANILSRDPKVKWTKIDADLYFQLTQLVKRITQIRYQNNRFN